MNISAEFSGFRLLVSSLHAVLVRWSLAQQAPCLLPSTPASSVLPVFQDYVYQSSVNFVVCDFLVWLRAVFFSSAP